MKHRGRISLPPLRHSLLAKIMLSCIAIFMIPMLLLYFFLSEASNAQNIRDAGYRYSVALKNVSDTMDEIFKSVNAMQNQLQADSFISDSSFSPVLALGVPGYAAWGITQSISRTVYQYYLNNPYIRSVELYNPYADILFFSRVYETRQVRRRPDKAQLLWTDRARAAVPRKWYLEKEESGPLRFVSYTLPFSSNNPTNCLYSRTTIYADILEEKFNALFLDKGLMLAISGEDGFFPAMGEERSAPLSPGGGEEPWFVYADGGERALGVRYTSGYTGWAYWLSVPVRSFNASSTVINRYFGTTYLCLALILLALLAFLLSEVIYPINAIRKGIRVAETGDLSVRIHLKHNDELGKIGNQINVLLENIEQLIYENYETRMLKNEYELKFIQNQLKEHFLYNTLDSMHWIAHSHHVPEISEIIFHLSQFFRLTLNEGNDRIRVSQAAEILKSYITLINVRMEQSIRFEIDLDASLRDKLTYKYFFQPIVENAYQHGLRPKLGGSLRVSFREAPEGWLRYTVTDDGVGMPQERLQALREELRGGASGTMNSDGNFALKNIRNQLALYFGDQYEFSITSQPAEGTTVVIAFPLKD